MAAVRGNDHATPTTPNFLAMKTAVTKFSTALATSSITCGSSTLAPFRKID